MNGYNTESEAYSRREEGGLVRGAMQHPQNLGWEMRGEVKRGGKGENWQKGFFSRIAGIFISGGNEGG